MLSLMILIDIRLSDNKKVAIVLVVELDIVNGLRSRGLVDLQVLSAFGTEVGDQVDADQVIFICGYDQVCVHLCHL